MNSKQETDNNLGLYGSDCGVAPDFIAWTMEWPGLLVSVF